MAFCRCCMLINVGRYVSGISNLYCRGYAVKRGPATTGKSGTKLGPMMEKKVLEVETDVNKLVNYVCGSNIYKQGENIKLKDDSEYPDWLWTFRLGKVPDLDELDPSTLKYWRRYRKLARLRDITLKKGKF